MTLLTLEAVGVIATKSRFDIAALFKAEVGWIKKESFILRRSGKPRVSEMKYMVGKSAWEAIQDATYRRHGDSYREFLPDEAERRMVIEDALKRSAELCPDYFSQ